MMVCVIYIDFYLWVLFMKGESIFLHVQVRDLRKIKKEKNPDLPTSYLPTFFSMLRPIFFVGGGPYCTAKLFWCK